MHAIRQYHYLVIGLLYAGIVNLSWAEDVVRQGTDLLTPPVPSVLDRRYELDVAVPIPTDYLAPAMPAVVEQTAPDSSSVAENCSCCNCAPADDCCVGVGAVREYFARKHAYYWGNRAEFRERPLGSWAFAQMNAQVINGLAEQSTLYRYDFYDVDSELAGTLTPRGQTQLQKIARILTFHAFPVSVESTGDAQLDATRRLHVFEGLAQLATEVTEDQVVTGKPSAHGLSGLESIEIYNNLLQQTRNRGGNLGGGARQGGGSGGGGFGGGGSQINAPFGSR